MTALEPSTRPSALGSQATMLDCWQTVKAKGRQSKVGASRISYKCRAANSMQVADIEMHHNIATK